MGDFRVSGTRRMFFLGFFVMCTLIRSVPSTGLGKCPIYPQLPNFDIRRMAGTWYEIERSFYLMEVASSCTELEVALNERDYLLITVKTINRWTGSPSTTHGLGIPSYNGSSVFRYKRNNRMPYMIGRLLPGAGLYNILLTDYERFAILWSCTNLSIAHSDRMWVLGRARELEAEARVVIYAALQEMQLDPDRLVLAKHENCTRPAEGPLEN